MERQSVSSASREVGGKGSVPAGIQSMRAVLPQPRNWPAEGMRRSMVIQPEMEHDASVEPNPVSPARRIRERSGESVKRSGKLVSTLIAAILVATVAGVAAGWALKERFRFIAGSAGNGGATGLVDTGQIRADRQAERAGMSVILDVRGVLDQFFAASREDQLKALLVRHGDGYPLIDSLIALHENQAITGRASDLMVFHTGWARVDGEIVEEIRLGGPLATKAGTRIIKVYLYKIGNSWKVDGYVYEQSMTGRLTRFDESGEADRPRVLTVELVRKLGEYDRIEARPPGAGDVLFSFPAMPDTPGYKEFRKIEMTGKSLKNLRIKRSRDGAIELADDPIVSEIAYWPGGGG